MGKISIEKFLDNILLNCGKDFDRDSEVFEMEAFTLTTECLLNDSQLKWIEENHANPQMVFVPLRDRVGEEIEGIFFEPKMNYYQIENGLYVSPSLIKLMNIYEIKRRRKSFNTF